MAKEFDKVLTYGTGPPCTKSCDFLIASLCVASWQIKNVTSLIPQVLRTPTLTG